MNNSEEKTCKTCLYGKSECGQKNWNKPHDFCGDWDGDLSNLNLQEKLDSSVVKENFTTGLPLTIEECEYNGGRILWGRIPYTVTTRRDSCNSSIESAVTFQMPKELMLEIKEGELWEAEIILKRRIE